MGGFGPFLLGICGLGGEFLQWCLGWPSGCVLRGFDFLWLFDFRFGIWVLGGAVLVLWWDLLFCFGCVIRGFAWVDWCLSVCLVVLLGFVDCLRGFTL